MRPDCGVATVLARSDKTDGNWRIPANNGAADKIKNDGVRDIGREYYRLAPACRRIHA